MLLTNNKLILYRLDAEHLYARIIAINCDYCFISRLEIFKSIINAICYDLDTAQGLRISDVSILVSTNAVTEAKMLVKYQIADRYYLVPGSVDV